MAGACLLVLLGSFFSPMAVGKARAEMDSAEEILSTLGTSPAKIYANYITGIDRVVEDAEGKLLYDAMLSEPESYFLCMTLDDDLDSVYMRSSQNSQPNSDTSDVNSRKER